MAAFSPATHKVVTSSTSNIKDALPIDARVLLASLFSTMGVFQVTVGNTAPADRDVLWWHADVKQFKRYDGVLGNWFPLVANQMAMHIIRRAILGSVQETNVETGDLFCFWDVSAGDLKKITRNDLAASILSTITTTEGVQGGGLMNGNRTIKLDINGLTTKAAPKGSDLVGIYSTDDSGHRKASIDQISAALTNSSTLHARMFFFGSF